jgi:branched-chain amino acid transport system substrate-binding protein
MTFDTIATRLAIGLFAAASVVFTGGSLRAADIIRVPVLVPLTGILALEGTSQRNGAVLALDEGVPNVQIIRDVADTAAAPEIAVNALERALSEPNVVAVAASIFGTQMLAMMPIAAERKVPLVTISGTAKLTEMGNPYVFRFFPTDAVVKRAQARYVVEELKRTRIALVYQSTAYGQSGQQHLVENLKRLGASVVFEESLAPTVKEMLPVLAKAKAANPDVLVLQLHSGPTALLIKQAAAMNLGVPIVAGSAMHQPSTAALLEPAELRGVCAESSASPVSGGTQGIERFAATYRQKFAAEPDAFALAQYDGMRMVLAAVAEGARNAESVRAFLASRSYEGLAMTYRSDGTGNMAHDAIILCYDGTSRIPTIVKRYAAGR